MTDKFLPLYALAFILALGTSALLEMRLIPMLRARAAQPIYKEGPSWHLSKSGTPTMGGVAFLVGITLSLLLAALFLFTVGKSEAATALLISVFFAVANSFIGIIDDLTKLRRKENAGLSPAQKLILQLFFAIIFLYLRARLLGDGTALFFSFGEVELGVLYYPLAIIMLLGITNCANLTDGIDGLASSVAFAVSAVLFYASAAFLPEAALCSAAVMGGAVGFLIFNIHPAKIFMGDTGSLFLGAILVSCSFSLKNPLLFVFVGGVYVIEGVSVILQVLFYKLTKKRIFKMAPIHHHLEKCGYGENKICIIAIIATFILSLPAFLLFAR